MEEPTSVGGPQNVAAAESMTIEKHDFVGDELDEGDRKMLPCRSFVQGFCEKPKCIFYHPRAEDVVTSIKCPPFPADFGTREAVDAAVKDLTTSAELSVQTKRGGSGPSRYGSDAEIENPFVRHGRSVPLPFCLAPPRRTSRRFNSRYDLGLGEADSTSLERHRPRMPRRPSGIRHPKYEYVHPNHNEDNQIQEPHKYIERYLPQVSLKNSPPVVSGYVKDRYDSSEDNDFHAQEIYPYVEKEPETMFDHIDWMQFLAPGQLPPPIVSSIPFGDPPVRKSGRNLLDFMVKPPGYSEPEPREAVGLVSMSAKQEFRLKLGQLATGFTAHHLQKEDESGSSGSEDGAVQTVQFSEQGLNPVAVK